MELNQNNGLNTLQPKDTKNQPPKQSLNDFQQIGDEVLPPDEIKTVLDEFEGIRITKEKDIPINDPVIRIGGKGIASKKNLTGISAAVKAGKTALTSVIIAGAISRTGEYDGFTGLQVEPNPEGKAVIDIDTEQAEDDQQHKVKTILMRCNLDDTPDYYLSYNFRQLHKKKFIESLNKICVAANEKYNGIHLISIDGGADFASSVNDDKEAADLVEYFSHLSQDYNCPLLLIIHLNPNSDKERGHLGSEIQRKCYGLITISKNDDVSTAQVKVGRKAGTTDTPLIHYRYDSSKGYHVTTDAPPDAADKKALALLNKKKELAKKVFKAGESIRHNEAVRKIMSDSGKCQKTAKNWLKDMVAMEFVSQREDGNYTTGVKWGNSG